MSRIIALIALVDAVKIWMRKDAAVVLLNLTAMGSDKEATDNQLKMVTARMLKVTNAVKSDCRCRYF